MEDRRENIAASLKITLSLLPGGIHINSTLGTVSFASVGREERRPAARPATFQINWVTPPACRRGFTPPSRFGKNLLSSLLPMRISSGP